MASKGSERERGVKVFAFCLMEKSGGEEKKSKQQRGGKGDVDSKKTEGEHQQSQTVEKIRGKGKKSLSYIYFSVRKEMKKKTRDRGAQEGGGLRKKGRRI